MLYLSSFNLILHVCYYLLIILILSYEITIQLVTRNISKYNLYNLSDMFSLSVDIILAMYHFIYITFNTYVTAAACGTECSSE